MLKGLFSAGKSRSGVFVQQTTFKKISCLYITC